MFPDNEVLSGCPRYEPLVNWVPTLREADLAIPPSKTVVLEWCNSGLHHLPAIPMRQNTPHTVHGIWTDQDDAEPRTLLESPAHVIAVPAKPLAPEAVDVGDYFLDGIAPSNRQLLAFRFIPIPTPGDTTVVWRVRCPASSTNPRSSEQVQHGAR